MLQDAMTQKSERDARDFDLEVRLLVYHCFADTGTALAVSDVAVKLGQPQSAVEDSYRRLEAQHAWALAPSTVNIWMAHPFSAVPTPYRVFADGRDYWANCGWDALALPALLQADSEILAQCADCGSPITLKTKSGSLSSARGVVHFAVPPRRFWENVGFT